jgi:hypothetical protein
MYDEALLQQIRDYLNQNRGTYTIEALRERLIRDGVPARAVDQVLAEPQPAYGGPPPQPPASASRWNAKVFFAVLVLSVVVNLLVGGGALALAIQVNNGAPFLLVPAALVAEIAAAVVYARKNTSVTVALVVALALSPVIAGVLLLGACIAIFAALSQA